jgi:hypothetical protein
MKGPLRRFSAFDSSTLLTSLTRPNARRHSSMESRWYASWRTYSLVTSIAIGLLR